MAELPHLLTLTTFLPLAVGIALIAADALAVSLGAGGLPERLWKALALAAALATFGLSALVWRAFDPTQSGYQFVEWAPWLPEWGIHWFVGADGISLVLLVLTTFLMPLVLLASWNDVAKQVKGYVFFMLFLETGMLGAFVSLNLFQFYLFWELMLIPMYFIIGIWGGPRRIYAAIKFFLFTMLGSLLMLVAILVIYYLNFEQQGAGAGLNFDFVRAPGSLRPALIETVIPLLGQAPWWQTQPWLFAAFALAFGIKVPLVPFHTWLPDAHVEAPTGGSVILAGVLLKLGTYGFVRFSLPLFPVASVEYAPVIFALSLAGILYGALVAMVQSDIKKLVAYSSVAHLGFVMLGAFALNVQGLEGSVLQMVNHGLSTGALFLLVGMLYERRHTREIGEFGGVAKPMPVYAALFGIVAMSSIGLPGAERLRRRVPDPAGRVPREPGLHGAGHLRRGAGRRLPALGLPAHDVRPGRAAREPLADRPRPARAGGDARDHRADRLDRRLPRELPGEDPPRGGGPPARDGDAQRGRRARSGDGPARRAAARGGPRRGGAMSAPVIHWGAVGPALLVTVGAMVVLMLEVFLAPRRTLLDRPLTRSWLGSLLALVASLFLALALLATWQSFLAGTSVVFNPANPLVRLDRYANFVIALLAFASLLSCLLSVGYLSELRIQHGEYYALLLLATAGMMLLVSAVDLVMVFLGIEIMSIPIYVLAGFDRRRLRSNESALKYFLIGSFASALLLYGMALLYGATGHTDFEGIRAGWDGGPLGLCGLALVLVGFAFKISSVPFHQWTPDVYEGAPTPVTAYMSVTVKLAAFAALLRLLVGAFPGSAETGLAPVLWTLAAATMVVGNVMAVIQDNVKRMLAYSSVAHAGYLLIALVTATPDAYAAMLFYLLAYVFTNLGAFAVIVVLAHRGQDTDRIEQYAGLAARRPVLAALMTLFMISLAGIPGTVGFMAKFYLFLAAVRGGQVVLTVVAVLTSLVSVYFYLRLPVTMYMHEPTEADVRRDTSSLEASVLAICAFAVVLLGILPNQPPYLSWIRALDWTRESIALLQ